MHRRIFWPLAGLQVDRAILAQTEEDEIVVDFFCFAIFVFRRRLAKVASCQYFCLLLQIASAAMVVEVVPPPLVESQVSQCWSCGRSSRHHRLRRGELYVDVPGPPVQVSEFCLPCMLRGGESPPLLQIPWRNQWLWQLQLYP